MASLRDEDPAALALLRIAVGVLVALQPEIWSATALEGANRALRTPQEGLGWFAAWVPVTAGLVHAARAVTLVAAISGAIGFRARASFTVLSVSLFYLLACAGLVGAASHGMHLWWFSVLLAVSPSDSVLAVDARTRRAPNDPVGVTCAIWGARALLAVVYFFPGYWKFRESGLAWAFEDNLLHQMQWKWFQNAWLPAVRLDHFPGLLRAGAAFVMLFELSFPLLVLSRRGRLVAALSGVCFHVFAEQFMRLGFASLYLCYSVLVEPRAVMRWLRDEPTEPKTASSSVSVGALLGRPIVLASGFLFLANAIQGFRGAVQAFPFACYPTFQYVVGRDLPDLEVDGVDATGTATPLLVGPRGHSFRPQRTWGTVWKLLGEYGGGPNIDGLRAFYEQSVRAGTAATPGTTTLRLRFLRVEYDTTPESWGKPPTSRTAIAEVPSR